MTWDDGRGESSVNDTSTRWGRRRQANRGKDRRQKLRRRLRRPDLVERAAEAFQFIADGMRIGIGEHEATEFGAVLLRQLAVDLRLDEFEVLLVDHDQSIPLVCRASFNSWRPVNSRDLTVFSGSSRIWPMSS